jgi:hypothetical protein
MTDPFAALGLPGDADADEVRAARRSLAKDLHPDAGGDPGAMAAINDAARAALESIARRAESVDASGHSADTGAAQNERTGARPEARTEPATGRFAVDAPSFTVEALPVETFEALLVVASWIGEVLDDDPPYRLEVMLREPSECWCALDVVPDAGASTVSLQVASIGDQPAPGVETVRDVWIAHLNRLDWA